MVEGAASTRALASSSLGAYAGSVIKEGLIKKRLHPCQTIGHLKSGTHHSVVECKCHTGIGSESGVLSFGIPFALFPLVTLCSDANIIGEYGRHAWVSGLEYLTAGTLSVLNALLIWLSFRLVQPVLITALHSARNPL